MDSMGSSSRTSLRATSDSMKTMKAGARSGKRHLSLIERMQAVLDERVEQRADLRLTDSPACLVVAEHDMGAQIRQYWKLRGKRYPILSPPGD